ncbi:MAG: beta-lactamase family protein [Melioribacteraceae bacterium]|nr:beta-lactamase family protein [Melioribacteraceae bacterium]
MRFQISSFFLFTFFLASLIWRWSSDSNEATVVAKSISEITPKFVYVENSPISQKIDSFFSKRNKRGLFNGNVLFSIHDTIIYEKSFGLADIKKKDSLDINSSFQLASVSKVFTAYAIMLLKQRGELSYSDSLRKFFPEFPYRNITIHQLLIHRSGLSNYMYFSDKFWRSSKNLTIDNSDVIDLIIEHEPKPYYWPGRRYNYNNTNYALLASIIEKVSSKSYSEFMKDEIFTPLEMNDSYIYDKNVDSINFSKVKGYVSWRRRADNTYLNGVVGDKGVYSSVGDLNKFSRALLEGTLVNLDELENAYQLGHKELYDHDNYGYGWRINMLPDSTKIVYHTGWWKGFRSYFIRSLVDEKTIIVLTNKSKSGVLRTKELMKLFDIKYE